MNLKDKMADLAKEDSGKKSDFPIEIFPKPIQTYILQCNETLDSNIDYMSAALLWGVSSIVGNSCVIQVKNGWREYCSIWVACVGSAGVGKTPSIAMAIRPFEMINSEMVSKYRKDLDAYKNDESGTMSKPRPEQFIVNDITIEALVQLHSNNKNAIGMFREELDGWVKNMSRYSNGSDLPFWLSTWSGKAVSMNRKSGDSYLPKPFVPILGGVQPAILESFSTEENKSNGFLDRILLCCPDISIEMYNSKEMDYDGIVWYDDFVKNLSRSVKHAINYNDDFDIVPNVFKMTEEADAQWQKIYNEISLLQNSDDENEYMRSVYPKQKSYIPRFCLILHLIKNPTKITETPLIDVETVLSAWKLSKYFIEQAKKVKVEAKETKSIQSIISTNKEATPKDKFKAMYDGGSKLNYVKIAELLDVTRATLYNWKSEFDRKQNG